MAKNHALLSGRSPVRDGPGALLLAMVVLWGGCSTGCASTSSRSTSGQQPPPSFAAEGGAGGFPENNLFATDAEKLLAPFLACTSPAAFVELQRGVDMARLVEKLDDWSAVRLGALGPVLPAATEALNRKRASFLVTATQEYGVALAEVFALFVIHSAFDKDLEQVLRQLAQDRRLGQTLEQMAVAREQLRQRGFHLSDYPDRPERPLGDGGRGARQGLGEAVSSAPLFQMGVSMEYAARKAQLPPPYQQALDEVEGALVTQALEPGNVLRGVLDELTFGVPLGFYHLAAGVGHGAYSLTQGQYEQATRELTPAALMVALYAGGKGVRALSEARGAPGTSTGAARALQGLELRLEELKATAERLRGQLGGEGLQELARYLRADPEAALLVAEGGEAGAAALYEARGNVPKAQAWLSQANSGRPGSPRTRGGTGKTPGGVASLADEVASISREVLDARFLEMELEVPGPRLSGNVAVLEKQLAALEKTPPAGAMQHALWSEYLQYGRGRLTDLKQGSKSRQGRQLEPPLKWDGYQRMREAFLRGLRFERGRAQMLRDEAALSRAQRHFLQDFDSPRVETYVGVRKPDSGLRFADVLVIEQKPPAAKPPRVETFSFKSRDFSGMDFKAIEAQMMADAREALAYYGETLDIVRPGLERRVQVQRVRLIYEGGSTQAQGCRRVGSGHDSNPEHGPRSGGADPMKTLSVHKSKPEDKLWLGFEGAFDSRAAREKELEPFLQTLEEYAGGWMPDVVKGKRHRKYSRAAIKTALEEEHDEVITTIGLYRTKWPALDLALSLWLRYSLLKFFGYVKPLSFFTEAERCHRFVEMVRAWACRYPVSYASAHSSDDKALSGAPRFGRDETTSRRDGFDKIYAVWWLNVFGPKLVESVGRERMLSTPAWRVEELPNGSILLVTSPTAAGFASDEARLAQARVLVHLRPELDFDTVLSGLRERSAALAPVAPHFHPDAAPLFSRIVDHVSSHERPRKISELNAWQPPERRQWLPASDALPANLTDTQRVQERYSLLAEHLVAMLHTEVPSVFQATPESLTDIDFLFWRQDVPGTRLRENLDKHILPAVGAYLGQVLVHHLDGQWIPRDKLLENQVLVGDRVWLPFLRAGLYLRSRQSLLDYSLTQLYREAERHRAPG